MALMSKPTHDPKLTRWWWRTLREWIYELIDPLWVAFRGENSDEIALANVTGINDISASELAILDGLTTTSSELNKLSGLTADAAELNKADRTAADGTVEASKNVVLDANKDVLGKRYDINQSLLDAVAAGAYMWFNGSSYVQAADDPSLRFGADDFTILIVYFKDAASSNLYEQLVAKGSGNATGEWSFGFYGTVNRLRFRTENGLGISLDSGIDNGLITAAAVVRSGDAGIIYVNGENLKQDNSAFSGMDFNDTAHGLDIGARDNGVYHRYLGQIYLVLLHNRALSADEVRAFCSGTPVNFADVGASQTDKVINGEDWTGATGSTPPNNWSDTGSGTAIYIIRDNTPVENFGDNKALEFSASGESKTLYQGVAQAGKRFRVSFVYRNLDGSSSSYVALGSSTNKATLQNTGISGDGILFEQDFIADGTDLMFFVDTGGTLQIDHVQVIQIGCVAAYQPAGITHAQWQDDSGNELHGSVSGAVPLNLPSNHVARYIKPGITGDTTLTDAVPAGYRIKSMVADVTGAGASMQLNVGTSAGGTDVVNNQDISSNGLFDLTVGKHIFNLSSAQSLYVNDDGGTTWSGVSVDLYIEMERVK